jgi:hypothetical protein
MSLVEKGNIFTAIRHSCTDEKALLELRGKNINLGDDKPCRRM